MREILRVHNQWRAKIANGQVTRGRPGPQPPAADMEQMVILFSIQYTTTLLKILLHHFSDVNVVLSFISFHHSHVSFGLQQNNIHYTLANYSSNVMHFICYSFIFFILRTFRLSCEMLRQMLRLRRVYITLRYNKNTLLISLSSSIKHACHNTQKMLLENFCMLCK